jgi:ABC-type uncharacterized transport system involved in gliding motility auxiliary subunit
MSILLLISLVVVWHVALVLWILGVFGPSRGKGKTLLAVECIGIITVCVILLVGRWSGGARVADLTEKKLYTLSTGTRDILGNLKSPITLKLYYSQVAAEKGPEQIQFWNQYQYYVRDILEEYVSRSNGKLKLEVIDPRPFSDEEEQAQAAGIKRWPLNEEESFYFGLSATNEYGKNKAIEFFAPDRQEFVEYDLSKLISDLTRMEKRKVGVLTSLPVMGPENMNPYEIAMMRAQRQPVPEPWTIVQQIGQSYDVVKAVVKEGVIGSETKSEMSMGMPPQGGTFAADLNFLIVIHPKNLDEPTKFAVDQFVMKGGKLIVFEDPCCFSDQPERENPYGEQGRGQASELNDLTTRWGLAMRSNTMAVDRSLAGIGPDNNPLLPSLNLNDKCTGTGEIISADLHSVRLFAAGVLEKTGKGGADVRPLLQTTADTAFTYTPAEPINPRTVVSSEAVSPALLPSGGPIMLAGIIRGKLTTNFPGGCTLPPPPEEPPSPAAGKPASRPATRPAKHLEALPQSPDDAAVVVIADVDMICDQMAYQKTGFGVSPEGDNAALLLNALDFLAGQKDLISIRSHGRYSRPFTRVDEIERKAVAGSEKAIKEANDEIQSSQQKLQELGENTDQKNVKVVSSEKLAERQKIQNEIKTAQTKVRHLQAERRQAVEEMRWTVEAWNLFGAPSIILVIAVALAILRRYHAAKWAGRRNGQ